MNECFDIPIYITERYQIKARKSTPRHQTSIPEALKVFQKTWYSRKVIQKAVFTFKECFFNFFIFQIYKDIKLRQENRRRQSSSAAALNSLARRKMEDNLAMVFMGIVGAFLFCHFLRVFLNCHEMLVIEEAMACSTAEQRSFPKWAIITNFFRQVRKILNL